MSDPKALSKATDRPSHWTISTTPREEFRGIFLDAWRLERDYFYDRNMHGVDWIAMRDRYLPLVDRVANRDELNEVIAQMVSELSALHTFVFGGDARKPADKIELATLGARLRRDEKAGGYVVEHIYLHDPDLPDQAPPLARPESLVKEGEVILSIDGQSLLSVTDERALLARQGRQQVMLHVKPATGETRDVLVKPIKDQDESSCAMRSGNTRAASKSMPTQTGRSATSICRPWAPTTSTNGRGNTIPCIDRQGLIIDMRHNHGGNIDSWLLGELLRKAWFYWQPRVGNPTGICNTPFAGTSSCCATRRPPQTAKRSPKDSSDFKMGKVIGTRTWGGEIWLSGSNMQADNGVATAAEIGVYGPEGKWLIEGHGVDPDIVVDNLPHATFAGTDAQLQAAIDLLKQEIKDDPRPVPPHPPYPDKSFKYPQ